jgi:hypothetical protein
MSPVIVVAPVLVIDEPARIARVEASVPKDTFPCIVVWIGIVMALVPEGVELSFLQEANSVNDAIARVVNNFR